MTRKELEKLYANGVISSKLIMYKEMKQKVAQLTRTGMAKSLAVSKVSKDTGNCERTVYRACKSNL